MSIAAVADSVGASRGQISRIERGVALGVAFAILARHAAVVGLDLAAKLYPGGEPIRDHAHVRLLADLRSEINPVLRWALEVPLPQPGDRRAWDAMISGASWRFGVEAETGPRDAQALLRQVKLKQRDGEVDGVLLALRDTRVTRQFLDEALLELRAEFPVGSRAALRSLREGQAPRGNALVIVPRRPRRGSRGVIGGSASG